MTGPATSIRPGRAVRTTGALVAGVLVGGMLMLAPPAGAAPVVAPAAVAPATAATTAARTTNVYFLPGSATVGHRYENVIAAFVAAAPRGSTVLSVRVHGYVQRSSNAANDRTLSKARATRTAAVLTKLHVRGTYVVAGKSVAGSSGTARRATITITYRLATPVPPKPTKLAQSITFTQPGDMDGYIAAGPKLGAVVPMKGIEAQRLVVSASSGLPVTVTTTTPQSCELRLADGTWSVTAYLPDTCRLTATQAGNAVYSAAAPVSRNFAVTLRPNTITFTQPDDMTWLGTDDQATDASSTGGSLQLTSLTPEVCTTVGTAVHMVKPGTCTLRATSPAIHVYAAAEPVERSFTINKAEQTITFDQPPALAFHGGSENLSATSTSGLAVSFSSPSHACWIDWDPWAVSWVQLENDTTCDIEAHQPGDDYFLVAPTKWVTVQLIPALG